MRPFSGAAVLSALLAAVLLAGCCTEAQYEERAVARAREFLLENSPELSVEQRAFVRYNLPVLLVEGIFGGSGVAVSDMSQICITWVIPGEKDAYLVFGASDGRLQSWYPNRLIRKTFLKEENSIITAVNTARKYVMNGQYYQISRHEYNCVRFENPQVIRSHFELPLDPEGTATAEELEARKKLTQFSLVWAPSNQANKVVISGLAQTDLSGFTVYGGGLMSPEYLQKHTLNVDRVIVPVVREEKSSSEADSSGKEEMVESSGKEK